MKKLLAATACLASLVCTGWRPIVRSTVLLPLQIGDVLSLTSIPHQIDTPGVTISPNGAYVAYVSLTRLARRLWIQNPHGGILRSVGPVNADSWGPAWSPSGTLLAFYTAYRECTVLAVYDVVNQDLRLTPVIVPSTAEAPQWLPNGRQLIVPTLTSCEGRSSAALVPTVSAMPSILILKSDRSQAFRDQSSISYEPFNRPAPVNFSLVTVSTGAAVVIVKNVRPVNYRLSPNGADLFYSVDKGVVASDVNNRVIFDVAVVDLSHRSTTIVAHSILTNFTSNSITWSRDSSMLAFIGGTLRSNEGIPSQFYGNGFERGGSCYLINIRSPNKLRRVSGQYLNRAEQVLWSHDDTQIYALADDPRSIAVISAVTGANRLLMRLAGARFVGVAPLIEAGNWFYADARTDEGETQLRSVDLASGNSKVEFEAIQKISQLAFSSDGAQAVYVSEDVSHPEDIWTANHDVSFRKQLTHLNPSIEKRQLGSREEYISWKTYAATNANGVILFPSNYDSHKRYPTIVWTYAGENEGSEYRDSFGFSEAPQIPYLNLQMLASRGYVIFVPNSALRVGYPMRDIYDVVLSGIDAIVAKGIADPKNVGVYGQSYGGYSTLALIVQTHRFKCAVATSGTADLFVTYATLFPDGSAWNIVWAEAGQGRMGGAPWQLRDRYVVNSPFFYLDHVQTPVLLEYGFDDPGTAFEMQEVFVALRRLGKDVTLVGYANEGHVLLRESSQIDFTGRMLDWFAAHLRPH